MTTTESNIDSTQLAIQGGPKAVGDFTGIAQPKIGVEEFFSIARRFGFSEQAMARLQMAVTNDDLPPGGPTLSRYATSNPKPAFGEKYEQLAREYFGTKHAMAVSSGTGALHAAMVAVGAGPGKEVIVPALGFIATAMAAALTGATPIFCDVDESLQMDPSKLEELITPSTVAVAPTHHWGVVADMDPIMAFARRYGIKVVEDCAQSPGARYKGKLVGTIGDVGCFSISAYKIIGGSEGGLVLCNDDRMFDRVQQLAESGGLWRKNRFAPPTYEGELFVGTNYRANELESAVDLVQLGKLTGIVERTRRNFYRVTSQLIRVNDIQIQKLNDPQGIIGYALRFFPQNHEQRDKLVAALQAEGVPCGHRRVNDWHLCTEMYPLQSVLTPHSNPDRCVVGRRLYTTEVAVAIDQWWSQEDCDMIARAINKVLASLCTVRDNALGWY